MATMVEETTILVASFLTGGVCLVVIAIVVVYMWKRKRKRQKIAGDHSLDDIESESHEEERSLKEKKTEQTINNNIMGNETVKMDKEKDIDVTEHETLPTKKEVPVERESYPKFVSMFMVGEENGTNRTKKKDAVNRSKSMNKPSPNTTKEVDKKSKPVKRNVTISIPMNVKQKTPDGAVDSSGSLVNVFAMRPKVDRSDSLKNMFIDESEVDSKNKQINIEPSSNAKVDESPASNVKLSRKPSRCWEDLSMELSDLNNLEGSSDEDSDSHKHNIDGHSEGGETNKKMNTDSDMSDSDNLSYVVEANRKSPESNSKHKKKKENIFDSDTSSWDSEDSETEIKHNRTKRNTCKSRESDTSLYSVTSKSVTLVQAIELPRPDTPTPWETNEIHALRRSQTPHPITGNEDKKASVLFRCNSIPSNLKFELPKVKPNTKSCDIPNSVLDLDIISNESLRQADETETHETHLSIDSNPVRPDDGVIKEPYEDILENEDKPAESITDNVLLFRKKPDILYELDQHTQQDRISTVQKDQPRLHIPITEIDSSSTEMTRYPADNRRVLDEQMKPDTFPLPAEHETGTNASVDPVLPMQQECTITNVIEIPDALNDVEQVSSTTTKTVQATTETDQGKTKTVQASAYTSNGKPAAVNDIEQTCSARTETVQASTETVVKASAGTVQVTTETVKALAETVQVTTKTIHAPAETVEASTETVQTPSETVQVTAEVVQVSTETVQASTETVHVSAETVQASTETVQATSETVQATNETVQGSNETVQATTGTVQASNEKVQASTETVHGSANTSNGKPNNTDNTSPRRIYKVGAVSGGISFGNGTSHYSGNESPMSMKSRPRKRKRSVLRTPTPIPTYDAKPKKGILKQNSGRKMHIQIKIPEESDTLIEYNEEHSNSESNWLNTVANAETTQNGSNTGISSRPPHTGVFLTEVTSELNIQDTIQIQTNHDDECSVSTINGKTSNVNEDAYLGESKTKQMNSNYETLKRRRNTDTDLHPENEIKDYPFLEPDLQSIRSSMDSTLSAATGETLKTMVITSNHRKTSLAAERDPKPVEDALNTENDNETETNTLIGGTNVIYLGEDNDKDLGIVLSDLEEQIENDKNDTSLNFNVKRQNGIGKGKSVKRNTYFRENTQTDENRFEQEIEQEIGTKHDVEGDTASAELSVLREEKDITSHGVDSNREINKTEEIQTLALQNSGVVLEKATSTDHSISLNYTNKYEHQSVSKVLFTNRERPMQSKVLIACPSGKFKMASLSGTLRPGTTNLQNGDVQKDDTHFTQIRKDMPEVTIEKSHQFGSQAKTDVSNEIKPQKTKANNDDEATKQIRIKKDKKKHRSKSLVGIGLGQKVTTTTKMRKKQSSFREVGYGSEIPRVLLRDKTESGTSGYQPMFQSPHISTTGGETLPSDVHQRDRLFSPRIDEPTVSQMHIADIFKENTKLNDEEDAVDTDNQNMHYDIIMIDTTSPDKLHKDTAVNDTASIDSFAIDMMTETNPTIQPVEERTQIGSRQDRLIVGPTSTIENESLKHETKHVADTINGSRHQETVGLTSRPNRPKSAKSKVRTPMDASPYLAHISNETHQGETGNAAERSIRPKSAKSRSRTAVERQKTSEVVDNLNSHVSSNSSFVDNGLKRNETFHSNRGEHSRRHVVRSKSIGSQKTNTELSPTERKSTAADGPKNIHAHTEGRNGGTLYHRNSYSKYTHEDSLDKKCNVPVSCRPEVHIDATLDKQVENSRMRRQVGISDTSIKTDQHSFREPLKMETEASEIPSSGGVVKPSQRERPQSSYGRPTGRSVKEVKSRVLIRRPTSASDLVGSKRTNITRPTERGTRPISAPNLDDTLSETGSSSDGMEEIQTLHTASQTSTLAGAPLINTSKKYKQHGFSWTNPLQTNHGRNTTPDLKTDPKSFDFTQTPPRSVIPFPYDYHRHTVHLSGSDGQPRSSTPIFAEGNCTNTNQPSIGTFTNAFNRPSGRRDNTLAITDRIKDTFNSKREKSLTNKPPRQQLSSRSFSRDKITPTIEVKSRLSRAHTVGQGDKYPLYKTSAHNGVAQPGTSVGRPGTPCVIGDIRPGTPGVTGDTNARVINGNSFGRSNSTVRYDGGEKETMNIEKRTSMLRTADRLKSRNRYSKHMRSKSFHFS